MRRQTTSAASSVKPPDEDRQAPEQRLLLRRQQVVAPGDRVAHRLQARRHIAGPAGQEGQAARQPRQQSGGGRAPCCAPPPARSPAASPSSRTQIAAIAAGVVVGEGEPGRPPWPARRRARTAGGARQIVAGGELSEVGHRQRRHRVLVFAARHAARARLVTRTVSRGQAGQELDHERAGIHHLLEVVEHQEQSARRAGRRPARARRLVVAGFATPRAPGRSPRQREPGRGPGRGDEGDAVGERRRPASFATAMARRVLPTPPGPVNVRRRTSSRRRSVETSRPPGHGPGRRSGGTEAAREIRGAGWERHRLVSTAGRLHDSDPGNASCGPRHDLLPRARRQRPG